MSRESVASSSHYSQDPEKALAEALAALRNCLELLYKAETALIDKEVQLTYLRSQIETERQRNHTFFATSPTSYLVTTFDGMILEANPSAAALIGADPEGLEKQPLVIFVSEGERQGFNSRLKTLYDIPTSMELRFSLQPKAGGPVPSVLRVGTVHADDGSPQALRWEIRQL